MRLGYCKKLDSHNHVEFGWHVTGRWQLKRKRLLDRSQRKIETLTVYFTEQELLAVEQIHLLVKDVMITELLNNWKTK